MLNLIPHSCAIHYPLLNVIRRLVLNLISSLVLNFVHHIGDLAGSSALRDKRYAVASGQLPFLYSMSKLNDIVGQFIHHQVLDFIHHIIDLARPPSLHDMHFHDLAQVRFTYPHVPC